MRRRPALLACSLLVGLVVGCGGGGGDDGGSTAADGGGDAGAGPGCGVLSTDEVAEIIGQDVTGASELPAGCTWTIDGPDPSSAYDWQRLPVEGFEANRVEVGGFVIEPLDDLGDEAYLRTMASTQGDPLSVETWARTRSPSGPSPCR